jgi:hypothetical protein
MSCSPPHTKRRSKRLQNSFLRVLLRTLSRLVNLFVLHSVKLPVAGATGSNIDPFRFRNNTGRCAQVVPQSCLSTPG